MRVRSLILFDLKNIIIHSNKKVLEFINLYGITNKTDINNLFIYNVLVDILEIYTNNKGGYIIFYLSQDDFNDLNDSKTEINYKKFIKIITKKIKFPIIISSIGFYYFCKLMATDCPEYEEITASYCMLGEFLDDIIKIVKKLKFYKLEKELVSDLKKRFKLLTFS